MVNFYIGLEVGFEPHIGKNVKRMIDLVKKRRWRKKNFRNEISRFERNDAYLQRHTIGKFLLPDVHLDSFNVYFKSIYKKDH